MTPASEDLHDELGAELVVLGDGTRSGAAARGRAGIAAGAASVVSTCPSGSPRFITW